MQQIIIQVIMAIIGVIGFSIMFNVHGFKILINGIGGAATWIVYNLAYSICNDKILSCFVATVFIAVLVEILARILKTPVILLLVPMIVPLVPGSDLYYMMYSIVMKDAISVSTFSFLLAGEAGAIAFGIIIITTITQIIVRVLQLVSKHSNTIH